MEEEANSWIRRTKFSHTICHRLDTARLVSIPFTVESNQMGGVKSRHEKVLVNPISGSIGTPIQTNPTTNKHRAVSPHPQTTLSDTFKEARSERKRFSTPHPRGKEEGSVERKPSRKNSKSRSSTNTSPLKHFSFGKFHDNGTKSKKDTSWTKFFDHGGGRVTAVGSSDELTVDLSKLMIGYRFAHGAHSRLYHGIYEDERVAIKLIRVPDDEENGVLGAQLENQFNREVRLLSRLHHPNVIKFIAAGIQTPVFCIVTEYLSEGSLRAYLHRLEVEDKTRKQSLPLQELIKMALDIARGMEYIHSQGVIHRDLKPENILISDDFQLKIADFGIGCEESHCDSLADDPGTYRWMAPEMIKRKSYGRKVDVYGFGLILWEMVSGTIPYEDMTPIQAAFAVVNKNMRPPIPVNCPPAMKALIEQCWSTHPDKRPEFWQVVKVLEQFETSLARDGTLNLVQSPTCQDHKKGLRHWIKKLGPVHHQHTSSSSSSSFSSMPKPKFS